MGNKITTKMLLQPATADIAYDLDMTNNDTITSQVNLQSFFYKHTPCIFFIINNRTEIIDCNDHMINMLDYTKQELCTLKSCNDLLNTQSRQRLATIRKKYLAAGQVSNLELQVIKKTGDELDITVNASVVKNSSGEIIYHLVVWNIVTELVDARRTIAQQTAQLIKKCTELERRNSELNTFANIVIHDLKAPLRAMNYFAELIDRDQDNKFNRASRSSFKLLRDKICRMSVLLNDIFAYFFNTQTHSLIVHIKWLEFLNDVKAALQIPTGFTIASLNMPETLDIQKLPLQQVFINIIQNAIKFHSDKTNGTVIITGSQDQDNYYFQINDNGPGIPQNYLQDIFKPLSRFKSRGNIEGSGLGLAIVDKIIQHHQGKIVAKSSIGVGTTFYFSWKKF